MTDRRQWPSELWMARLEDEPIYYISVNDCPRLPDDKRYVLAEWIWCDDRLPEPFVTVLACNPAKYISTAHWHPDLEAWYFDAAEGVQDVLAWQPLPPPPSAEQLAGYYTRTEGAP